MFSFWRQGTLWGRSGILTGAGAIVGRTGVAEVTVFIDDAVLGEFPPLCIKEGVPTTDRLNWREPVNRLGLAWFLLLFGPLGWLCLWLFASWGGQVSAKVPFCEYAYRRLKVAQRMLTIWMTFAVVSYLLALAAVAVHTRVSFAVAAALGAGALGATVKAVLENWRLRSLGIRLRLDGSRRWVTISGVHPAFAEAVVARRATVPGTQS
jgi:hypothetical protein